MGQELWAEGQTGVDDVEYQRLKRDADKALASANALADKLHQEPLFDDSESLEKPIETT